MSVVLAVAVIVLLLVSVFVVAYWHAGAGKIPLANAGRSGLLAVLVAVGMFLVGASLAARLDAFVLAPAMLLVGIVVLVLAGVAALQAVSPAPRGEDEERTDAGPSFGTGVIRSNGLR